MENSAVLRTDDFLGFIISHALIDKLYGGINDLQPERYYVNEMISDMLEYCIEQRQEFSEKIPVNALFGERLLSAKILLLERMEGENQISIFNTAGKLKEVQFTNSFLQSMADRLKNIKNGMTLSNGNSAQPNNQVVSCKPKLTVVKPRTLNEAKQTCPRPTFRRKGASKF